jgi:trigger factor
MSSAASAVSGSPAAGAAPSVAPAAADLRVTTNPLPASRVALEVEIPASLSLASYEAAIEQLGRSVRLPGFRKGRVPRVVLLQQLGPLRVRATALENLVDRVCRDALAQEEVAAIGRPELSEGFDVVLERYDPGSDLTITLELDVEPQPSLRATKGLTAEAEAVSHDPGRVEELIEQTRRQLATLVPVEGRAAREGDVAVVAFSGTFTDTGKPIEGGSGDALEVELEQGRMIPGFVEGVIGMEVGESRSVDCRFPESYPQEAAAGREARFAITLQELKARELPALDDAFAQQAGEKETLAELRADLETRLREDSERRARAARHEALLSALVEQLEVELPETLIREEIGNLIEQTAGRISQQGGDVKKLFTPDLVRSLMDTSRPQAELQLRRRLALRALAEVEQISVEDEAIERRVREISRNLSQQGSIDLERLRAAVADELLRETLLEWLESNSTITEKAPSPPEDADAEPGAAKACEGGDEHDAGAPAQA